MSIEQYQRAVSSLDKEIADLGCVSKVTNRENYASQRKAAAKWRKARYLQASFSKRIAILRQSLILIKKHSTRCLSL